MRQHFLNKTLSMVLTRLHANINLSATHSHNTALSIQTLRCKKTTQKVAWSRWPDYVNITSWKQRNWTVFHRVMHLVAHSIIMCLILQVETPKTKICVQHLPLLARTTFYLHLRRKLDQWFLQLKKTNKTYFRT